LKPDHKDKVITLDSREAERDSGALLPGMGALFAEAFPDNVYPGVWWSNTAWQFVILDGEGPERRLVSSAALLVRRCFVGAHAVRVGGIAGVATLASQRGRGYGAAVINTAVEKMRALDLPFGLLQCPDRRITFYESIGWRQARVPMFYHQPDGARHRIIENPMVMQLGEATWPEGEIDMNGEPW
jgi:GNAT superfamily N-acetyltransferase